MSFVRDCTLEDLDWLCEMTDRFNDKHFDVPVAPHKVHEVHRKLILDGVSLRTDDAAIVGVVYEDLWRDWSVLVELGWYSEGRGGLHVLKAFENRGRELGVDEVRMSTLDKAPVPARLLARRGYTPIETSHRLML